MSRLGYWMLPLVAGTAIASDAYVAIVLAIRLGWPNRYGPACHGLSCLLAYPWYSLALLGRGDVVEMLLFVMLWSAVLLPAALILCPYPYSRRLFAAAPSRASKRT